MPLGGSTRIARRLRLARPEPWNVESEQSLLPIGSLITSEKDLASFLALFSAPFCIKVSSGFFFSPFRLSIPLLIIY
jgi:hypothetical protein